MIKVGFAAFFLIYAEVQNWDVPDFHLDVCDFLEDYGSLGLLMMPRGHGKSTILDIYNAWKLYSNPEHLILHQGATDPDAYKVSRGTEQVLERHPLCQIYGFKKARGETQKWWCSGSTDVRHGSIHARGILSNVTGARANEIQNDDVEVPSNIGTPEARAKLRYRLGEQTHILIPGGQELYVGTPHTHDSLYSEIKQNPDAKCLIFKMFEDEKRFESVNECLIGFKPVYVFSGIGRSSKLLAEGEDYQIQKTGRSYKIALFQNHNLIDVYGEALWSKRFTAKEMQKRRRKCRTLNEWDSQYQLHAKPVGDVRLDPDKLIPYSVEPVLKRANGQYYMMLGNRQIVGMTARWDPASGKKNSDSSSVALVLHDDLGNKYWHRSIELTGEVIKTDKDGSPIGGQVWQLCDLIEEYYIPKIVIESNGIGEFAPASLKAALKKRQLRCGVEAKHSVKSKNVRILEAIEGPLVSGLMWAHVSVLDSVEGENTSRQYKQMQQFNPAITEQEDDHLDSLAGAIVESPERVGKLHRTSEPRAREDWRTTGGIIEAPLDFQ
ncbi:phage terminase large subunit [Acinetobacter larvae]|uniref:Transcriptional regulator n=1 Tax=Acinetobacter larvae TaxID=1789224 RepID=A0A1B2LXC5_9GAMM|nr:phage terminase large subunit [Acinetobacter larvae]AOA57580.1 transcriptional regulator [Acinetobacter larvae]